MCYKRSKVNTLINPWVDYTVYGQLHRIKGNHIWLQNEMPQIQFRSWIMWITLSIKNGAMSDMSEESCTISSSRLHFQSLLSVIDLFWGETGMNKRDWMRTNWNSFTEDQIDTSQTLSSETHINPSLLWLMFMREKGTHERAEICSVGYTSEQLQYSKCTAICLTTNSTLNWQRDGGDGSCMK